MTHSSMAQDALASVALAQPGAEETGGEASGWLLRNNRREQILVDRVDLGIELALQIGGVGGRAGRP